MGASPDSQTFPDQSPATVARGPESGAGSAEPNAGARAGRPPSGDHELRGDPSGRPVHKGEKTSAPPSWVSCDRKVPYRELEHPADLLLEIQGPDLAGLFENALFAFYDQTAELDGFAPGRELSITLSETSPANALRALLNEALYHLETEGFVAVTAEVEVETDLSPGHPHTRAAETGSEPGDVEVAARLWGENAVAGRHTLATEIKAVTYHRLTLERKTDGAYRATVLFDV